MWSNIRILECLPNKEMYEIHNLEWNKGKKKSKLICVPAMIWSSLVEVVTESTVCWIASVDFTTRYGQTRFASFQYSGFCTFICFFSLPLSDFSVALFQWWWGGVEIKFAVTEDHRRQCLLQMILFNCDFAVHTLETIAVVLVSRHTLFNQF